MTPVPIPRIVEMINPTLQALRELGNAGTNGEIRDEVAQIMELSDAQLQVTFTRQGSEIPKIENHLAWVKVYLGAVGFIDKSTDGVWTLTEAGKKQEVVDPQAIMSQARLIHKG